MVNIPYKVSTHKQKHSGLHLKGNVKDTYKNIL